MNIEEAINKKRLVDFNLFQGEVIYRGICLLATKKIVVIVNYNKRQNSFDGISIFRNKNFESFEVWKKKYTKINTQEIDDNVANFNIKQLRTYYTWFKKLRGKELVAIFCNNNFKDYDVGQILEVEKDRIKVRLVDIDGKWNRNKVFKIEDINYFSFGTKYEQKLQKLIKL